MGIAVCRGARGAFGLPFFCAFVGNVDKGQQCAVWSAVLIDCIRSAVFPYNRTMAQRIKREWVDGSADTLCEVLSLPTQDYEVGNIFVQSQYGYNTIQQVVSDGGAVQTLATGLTLREAHEWLCAAIRGACMMRDGFKPHHNTLKSSEARQHEICC